MPVTINLYTVILINPHTHVPVTIGTWRSVEMARTMASENAKSTYLCMLDDRDATVNELELLPCGNTNIAIVRNVMLEYDWKYVVVESSATFDLKDIVPEKSDA